jgi:hypothetical protein
MADQPKKYRTWLTGLCLGLGIAFGNGSGGALGIESRPLRILVGAVVGGLVAALAILVIKALKLDEKK